MPNFRRWFTPGGVYFFTVITDHRAEIFSDPVARTILSQVLREAKQRWYFDTPGIVLLPEHIHAIWALPPGDTAYPRRWGWIKKEFTKRWLALGGVEQVVTPGRTRDGRRGVWQPKFWEHTIRDEADFERHMHYIHFNPVKHRRVARPLDWEWTSFHRWVRAGVYDPLWGAGDVEQLHSLKLDTLASTAGE